MVNKVNKCPSCGFNFKKQYNASVEITELVKKRNKRLKDLLEGAWESGVNPYSMPIQWGVGSGHIGCRNEIILHVGHTNVQDHYLEERI